MLIVVLGSLNQLKVKTLASYVVLFCASNSSIL